MTSLIAGAAGFIGSHLTDALLAAGHAVVGVDNLSLGSRKNLAHLEGHSNFQFVGADFSSPDETRAIFDRFAFDEVYHLVANSDIRKSSENPVIEYDNTLNTTYHILENMRCCGVKRLFFASSSAIYGEKTDVILTEETGPLMPVSYLLLWRGKTGLGGVDLRLLPHERNAKRPVPFSQCNRSSPDAWGGVRLHQKTEGRSDRFGDPGGRDSGEALYARLRPR